MNAVIVHVASYAILILALMACGFSMHSKSVRIHELQTSLEAQDERIKWLRNSIDVQNKALLSREQKIEKLSKEKSVLASKLKEVSSDEQVKVWLDTPVPPAVGGMLPKERAADNP